MLYPYNTLITVTIITAYMNITGIDVIIFTVYNSYWLQYYPVIIIYKYKTTILCEIYIAFMYMEIYF